MQESTTINGYVSFTEVSNSGKHLVCTVIDESQPQERFSCLEDPKAKVATGTTIINGKFEYARDKEGNLIEPEWVETEAGKLRYHIGYLTDAEELRKGSGARGRLAKMLAEQE